MASILHSYIIVRCFSVGDTIVSPDRNKNEKTEMIYDVSEKEIPQQRIESNDEQLPQLRSYTGNDVSVFIRAYNLLTQLYIYVCSLNHRNRNHLNVLVR